MPTNPPENMPRITPYLYYKDVAGALDWLARAFGLKERMRMPGPGSMETAVMEPKIRKATTGSLRSVCVT